MWCGVEKWKALPWNLWPELSWYASTEHVHSWKCTTENVHS